MKKFVGYIVFLFATFMFVGCGSAELSPQEQALIDNKTEVYTQVPMWNYKDRVLSTNYSTGDLIPLNSKVKILGVTSKDINFEYNGQSVTLRNIQKHSKVTINELLARTFATKKVDLSKFSKKTKDNILSATLINGMSKDEVILARGYPPLHATESLKSDTWKYWTSRFNTIVISFKNDKVQNIVD